MKFVQDAKAPILGVDDSDSVVFAVVVAPAGADAVGVNFFPWHQ